MTDVAVDIEGLHRLVASFDDASRVVGHMGDDPLQALIDPVLSLGAFLPLGPVGAVVRRLEGVAVDVSHLGRELADDAARVARTAIEVSAAGALREGLGAGAAVFDATGAAGGLALLGPSVVLALTAEPWPPTAVPDPGATMVRSEERSASTNANAKGVLGQTRQGERLEVDEGPNGSRTYKVSVTVGADAGASAGGMVSINGAGVGRQTQATVGGTVVVSWNFGSEADARRFLDRWHALLRLGLGVGGALALLVGTAGAAGVVGASGGHVPPPPAEVTVEGDDGACAQAAGRSVGVAESRSVTYDLQHHQRTDTYTAAITGALAIFHGLVPPGVAIVGAVGTLRLALATRADGHQTLAVDVELTRSASDPAASAGTRMHLTTTVVRTILDLDDPADRAHVHQLRLALASGVVPAVAGPARAVLAAVQARGHRQAPQVYEGTDDGVDVNAVVAGGGVHHTTVARTR